MLQQCWQVCCLYFERVGNLTEAIILHAGNLQLDVQDGTFRQEPGSGVSGQVQGTTVAVGNLDWVRSHSQTDTSTAGSRPHGNSNGSSQRHASAEVKQREESSASSDDISSSSSSRSTSSHSNGSSSNGSELHLLDDSITQSSTSSRAAEEAETSTSGRTEAEGAGIMTVYIAVNGKLAGVFEIQDQLRPDAAATIRGLQQQGIDTILLSGRESAAFYCAMPSCATLCCNLSRWKVPCPAPITMRFVMPCPVSLL